MSILALLAILIVEASAQQNTPGRPNPATLIVNARKQVDWIFETKSLVLKTRIKTTRSDAEVKRKIATLRNEMRRWRPDQPTVTKQDIEERPWLSRSNQQIETVIWDRENYYYHLGPSPHETIITWDGIEGRRVYKKPDGNHEWYRRPEKPIDQGGNWFGYLWTPFGEDWRPQSVPSHPTTEALRKRREEHAGKPDGFVYVGITDFHGTKAHMLRNPNGLGSAAMIDVATGRFCGWQDVTLRIGYDGTWEKTVAAHFKSIGQAGSLKQLAVQFRRKEGKGKEYDACLEKFKAKVDAVRKAPKPEDYKPVMDLVFEDTREVEPGKWFPMKQRRIDYEHDKAATVVKLEEVRTIFRLELNKPIEDKSVFRLEIPTDAKDVRTIRK